MAKTSYTQRSLAHLRKQGRPAEVVERWMSFTQSEAVPDSDGRVRGGGYRRDLFQFIDIIAIMPTGILAVQSTSKAQLAPHMRKLRHDPKIRKNVVAWLEAGAQLAMYGWAKVGSRWHCEVRVVTLEMMQEDRKERAAKAIEYAPPGRQLDLIDAIAAAG